LRGTSLDGATSFVEAIKCIASYQRNRVAFQHGWCPSRTAFRRRYIAKLGECLEYGSTEVVETSRGTCESWNGARA